MSKVILSGNNYLFTDERLEKMCDFLAGEGFDVLLVGRRYRNSPDLPARPYATRRLHLCFKKGFAFYAEYNLRLFFFLLFQKCDVLVANDLDTLLPNYLVAKIKGKKLVYDSHEYFCGLPELVGRPRVQRFWHGIEKACFPKLPIVLTVCRSIADLYDREYPRPEPVKVVRNFPRRTCPQVTETRASLGLPENKKLIVMQGAINKDRGAEELLLAMHEIPDSLLLIIGNGDVIPQLKNLVEKEKLTEKVRFIPRQTPERLFQYTVQCDLGCSLEKDTNLNYRFCLPNKLFDYIRAGVPALVSNLPEMSRIVAESGVGEILPEHSPHAIAAAINQIFSNQEQYSQYQQNTKAAAERYCWENEMSVLKDIYLR